MTAATTPQTLLSLPEEVLSAIISCIPDSTLIELSRTCKKLNRICLSPLEMRQRCLRCLYWEERHNIQQKKASKQVTAVPWQRLFFYRQKVFNETTYLLNEIISRPTDHVEKFNRIARFGYDAKDCLATHADISSNTEDPLARSYHATAAIRCIHRRRALSIWKAVHMYEDVPIELALLGFDLFVSTATSPDVANVLRALDDLAAQFLSTTPDFTAFDTEEKSVALIEFMWAQGFKGTPVENYRALKNVFIGLTITTIHTAIPLTLVVIFCALARRVGLTASPCDYPDHVLAVVTDPSSEHQYYDLFPGPGFYPRVPRSQLLANLGAPPDLITNSIFMSPATTSSMLNRTAQNILASVQLEPNDFARANNGYPEVDQDSCLYAALTAIIVLGQVRQDVVRGIMQCIQAAFPMDVRFLEEEVIPRMHESATRLFLQNICGALRAEDLMPRDVHRRDNPSNERVLHRVGTVFRHKKYNYAGAICGWTNECRPSQGEEWINAMDVDMLPRGRKQPFYHVLVDDGSIRYVAEENICPVKPKDVSKLLGLAGKYFKRFDTAEGRFVSNMRTEFPDD